MSIIWFIAGGVLGVLGAAILFISSDTVYNELLKERNEKQKLKEEIEKLKQELAFYKAEAQKYKTFIEPIKHRII